MVRYIEEDSTVIPTAALDYSRDESCRLSNREFYASRR